MVQLNWTSANLHMSHKKGGLLKMATNGTLMQFFHWYYPGDGSLWNDLASKAEELKNVGFTALWLPPAYKGWTGVEDRGYGIYDLFDLGEFEQKETVRTRWGTKEEFLNALSAAKAQGIQVYEDIVFNHKNGADETEEVEAVAVDRENRNNPPPGQGQRQLIEVWSRFLFPGRGDIYSPMKWHWYHFDATDFNQKTQSKDILWRLKEKVFDTPVDPEKGNFDYLQSMDLDMDRVDVRENLKFWGEWFIDLTSIDGFRIDAAKHIRFFFFNELLDYIRSKTGKELFSVAEYFDDDTQVLQEYIRQTGRRISLFDFPLQNRFHLISQHRNDFSLADIFNGTLTQADPTLSVQFIENHDLQPGRENARPVEPWFKPLAYALILLRQEGYPSVFYPDFYGAQYTGESDELVTLYDHSFLLKKFMYTRLNHAYGPQHDYFDHSNIVGWTRTGDSEHPKALAVIMSDGPAGTKWMNVERSNAQFHDITEHTKEPVQTNSEGWGEFRCKKGSVSVWIED
jgi:alpha-amylase